MAFAATSKGESKQIEVTTLKGRAEKSLKVFFLYIGMKKGALRGVIEERRKGVSSWVGLGPVSLGFFLEGIE